MALEFQTVVRGSAPQRLTLGEGRTRVPARPGSEFKIVDDSGKVIPGTSVKRVDNHLVVEGLPGGRSVEITDFFTACAPSGASSCSLSMTELGSTAGPITPASDPIAALPDGSFLLYGGANPGAPAALSAPIIAAADNSWKAIGAGIGGLAIAGLAVGAGGGGGGGSSQDTTAPPPPAFTSKAALNGLAPTFTGTAEPGARVLVRIDVNKDGSIGNAGDVTFETIALADGTWRISTGDQAPVQGSWSGRLVDGQSYAVSAIARDVAGNQSTATNTTVAIDATAPAVPTVAAIAVDSVVNRAESLAGVTVSGTGEANTTVTVVWGGTTKTGTVDPNGNWSLLFGTTELPQAQGASVVSTTLTDEAGNVSPTVSRVVVIDSVAPAAPTVTSGALTNLALPTFTGTAEAGAKVRVSIDLARNGSIDAVYETTASATGAWSVNTQTPAAGTTLVSGSMGTGLADKVGSTLVPNALSIVAIDASGNAGTATASTISRDSTIPAAPTINTVAGDNIVNFAERGTITITGSLPADSSGQPVTVTWGGITKTVTATAQTFSVSFTVGEIPPDGAAPVTAVSQSATGVQGVQGTLAVSVDSVAPAAPTAPAVAEAAGGLNAAEAADGTAVVVSLAGTGAVAGDTIRVNWGGQVTSRLLTGGEIGAGSASVAIGAGPISTQGDGTVSVTATITDVAGNVGATSAATSVVVDTAGPTQALSSFTVTDDAPLVVGAVGNGVTTNDPTPSVTLVLGSVLLAGETMSLFRDGGPTAVATATAGATTINFAEASALADGVHTYSATIVDGTGNTRTLDLNGATAGTSFTFVVDATPPAAPLGAPDLATASDTGFSPTDKITTDTTPTFVVGALAPGATDAVLYINGAVVSATYSASGGGTLTVDPGAALTASPTARTFTFAWEDAAGNVSGQSPGLAVTVDAAGAAPTAPTGAPDLLAASDSGILQTDNITNTPAPFFVIGALPGGVSGANLYIGGVLTPSTYSPANGGTLQPNSPVVGSGTTQTAAVTYTYVDAFNVESTASPPLSVTFDRAAPSDGAVTITFSSFDDAGTLPAGDDIAFTHDVFNPALTDTTPTLTITVSGLLTNDRITLTGGTLAGATTITTITANGTVTIPNASTLTGTPYFYTASLGDAAGNASTILDINGAASGTDFVIRTA